MHSRQVPRIPKDSTYKNPNRSLQKTFRLQIIRQERIIRELDRTPKNSIAVDGRKRKQNLEGANTYGE